MAVTVKLAERPEKKSGKFTGCNVITGEGEGRVVPLKRKTPPFPPPAPKIVVP
jgi:hypothetical protein